MANTSSRTSAQKPLSSIDPELSLESRCVQLASLTLLLTGEGCAHFHNMYIHDRDNILWLINDLATEIRDMVTEVCNEHLCPHRNQAFVI